MSNKIRDIHLCGTGVFLLWIGWNYQYNQKENSYTASGNVVIQKDDKTLSAETVRLDRNSMEAFATGNVLIKVNEDRLSGDWVDINLNTGTGIIEKGLIFVEKKHFYKDLDEIQ